MFSRRSACHSKVWSRRLQSSYTRRTPEPAPPELAHLIAAHAQLAPRPLTLGTLFSFARPLTPESVLSSVQYVQAEMPRRLATRIRSLEALPFIVGTNPHIARILEGFRRNFLWSASYPPVTSLEENAAFVSQLENIIRDSANDIPPIAKGCVPCPNLTAVGSVRHCVAASRSVSAICLLKLSRTSSTRPYATG
jgi:hypothetical protein